MSWSTSSAFNRQYAYGEHSSLLAIFLFKILLFIYYYSYTCTMPIYSGQCITVLDMFYYNQYLK